MFKLNLSPLFAPEDAISGGGSKTIGGPGDMSKEDMIDFMAEDDNEDSAIPLKEEKEEKPKPQKKEEKPSDEEEEPTEEESEGEEESEDDELADLEAELEEPSDEQLELVTPVRRRDILKKYPNLFKEFPYLEKAYYREQQFTELLPTIDDAKIAVEKSEILDKFEGDIMKGNTETVLKAVRETNPNSFLKLVDDYLPALARVDEQAYFHVIGNVTKHTIVTMVQEARKTNNEQLLQAAHLVNQFVFGSSDFQPIRNLSREQRPEDNTREQELTERERSYVRQQFEGTRDDLNTRVNNTLRNTIDANIDPKSSMSDYVRKNASREALESLENLINQDTRFKTLVDKLWENAYRSNFTRDSVDKIRSAYVSKAKTLLPSVIKKARNEALRGMGKRVKDDDTSESTPKRGPIPAGRPRSQESRPTGKIRDAKDIPKGMSTLEFLSSD